MPKLKNKSSLFFIVAHAVLVIVWNLVGVWLLSNNKPALGPTATLTGALIFALLIAAYLYSFTKGLKKTYNTLVIIGALFGCFAIYGALTKAPSLWPSEFWRY
ncbi:MAG: hypothetical protein KAH07_06770, partial [Flavobacteriaceae bacterium]|nr:hypothetical protein [Flavobacteriaceae bacterium]